MEFHSWFLFSTIALVATITPGPAVLLVSSHSIIHGPRKALLTVLGNITGLFFMSIFSVVGLSTLVLFSSSGFTLLKIAGAAYLIYLGVRLWSQGFSPKSPDITGQKLRNRSAFRLFFQGLTVALSNPKAIGFTTALFPQFINHTLPLVPQFSILVCTFMLYSFICLAFYGWLSFRTRHSIKHSRYERLVSRIFASLFIGSGIGLGVSS
jgi:homoserine/homoserine lactone efflux protein